MVEQRDNPEPGQTGCRGGSRERGVVAAASYEARKFGVRSAIIDHRAAAVPRPDLRQAALRRLQGDLQQIRAIFAEHTLVIEPLSLDEAYLDVTEKSAEHSAGERHRLAIRAKIRAETGLNAASAGISHNKFLAKLASDHRKPNGQYFITPDMGPGFVETLPVGKFHAHRTATNAKMNALGIFTGLDLRKQDFAGFPGSEFREGRRLLLFDLAGYRRAAVADRIRKSVGAENTFSSDLTEFAVMAAELQPLIEKVWRHCKSTGNRGRTVTLKIKFADFEIISRSHSFLKAISGRDELERASIALLERAMPLPKAVRLLGVSLSSLQADDVESPQIQLLF